MGIVTDIAEGAVGISASIWFRVGCLAAIPVALLLAHHHIYQEGYQARVAEEKVATDKQNAAAQVKIATIGGKYAQIDQNLQKSAGFMHPVSPLVGTAIGRMPQPTLHRAK